MAETAKKKYDSEDLSTTADVIAMLTGFTTYDTLATAGHAEKKIVAIIAGLVHLAASRL